MRAGLGFGLGLAGLALAMSCSSSDENEESGSSSGASTSSSGGGSSGAGSSGSSGTSGSTSSGTSGASGSSGTSGSSGDAGPKAPLFAFVGQTGKISVYAVDDTTGAWTPKKESAIAGSSSFLAFDPAKRRIVATDETGGNVRSLAFDPQTGAITEKSAKPAGGAGTTHVSLDPTGKWVFVANYTGGNMSVFPIDANGMLGAATATRSPGAMTHWIGTDPAGTRLFAVSLGGNTIAQYTLDTTTGTLADNGNVSPPANSGPRHVAFHPNEKWAYVVNESAITVTALDYAKATGKLTAKGTVSALPQGQNKNGVSGAEIVVHPSGKHVYASTRVYNSIAHFTVGADGALTLAENADTGGNRPRSFAMDPEGTLVFAANQDVNQVVGFKVDATTGKLTSMGKAADVAGPTFVGLARIP